MRFVTFPNALCLLPIVSKKICLKTVPTCAEVVEACSLHYPLCIILSASLASLAFSAFSAFSAVPPFRRSAVTLSFPSSPWTRPVTMTPREAFHKSS